MKKILTVAVMLFLGLNAFAPLNVGAGYLFEFAPIRRDGTRTFQYEMHGVYGGASYNIEIAESGFGVAPGAYISWAGGVSRAADGTKAIIRSPGSVMRSGSRRLALTIPVYATYYMELGPGDLFVYAGPSFQCGLSLKTFTKGKEDGTNVSYLSENLYGKNYDVRPFDLKLGSGFGYRWNFLQANIGVDFGLIDAEPGSKGSCYFHSIHVGGAYVF